MMLPRREEAIKEACSETEGRGQRAGCNMPLAVGRTLYTLYYTALGQHLAIVHVRILIQAMQVSMLAFMLCARLSGTGTRYLH